jgi:hypothetical protein
MSSVSSTSMALWGLGLGAALGATVAMLYTTRQRNPESQRRQCIVSDKNAKPIGPYSQGVKVGSTLYVSGAESSTCMHTH